MIYSKQILSSIYIQNISSETNVSVAILCYVTFQLTT